MTPDELAEIWARDAHVGYVTESMNIYCRQDRHALLLHVAELTLERARMLSEMDQLRAQMAHALKELQSDDDT
jgi:hypothetical protein